MLSMFAKLNEKKHPQKTIKNHFQRVISLDLKSLDSAKACSHADMVFRFMSKQHTHIQMELRSDGCHEHLVASAGGALCTDQRVVGSENHSGRREMHLKSWDVFSHRK